MSETPHPAPAEGGTGSVGLPMDVRVVARKRGPSGDLTAKTRIGTVATRSWPVPRSHPRKRGPCSAFHRPPQRDARRRISACYCTPSRSHPVNGSLLHAPAHLSPGDGGEGTFHSFTLSLLHSPRRVPALRSCARNRTYRRRCRSAH